VTIMLDPPIKICVLQGVSVWTREGSRPTNEFVLRVL
jgi:hypothetical protein